MNIWPKIYFIGYGDNPRVSAMRFALDIRMDLFIKRNKMGIQSMPCVEICLTGNIKKQLGIANKNGASHVVILHDGKCAAIKDMTTGEQMEMPTAYIRDECCRLMEERFC